MRPLEKIMQKLTPPNSNSATAYRWDPNQVLSLELLERLPAGAYACDTQGLITYFNQQAVRLWGREPKLNDPVDRFCGSFKLFALDGSPIAHDQCWMAQALQTQQNYDG